MRSCPNSMSGQRPWAWLWCVVVTNSGQSCHECLLLLCASMSMSKPGQICQNLSSYIPLFCCQFWAEWSVPAVWYRLQPRLLILLCTIFCPDCCLCYWIVFSQSWVILPSIYAIYLGCCSLGYAHSVSCVILLWILVSRVCPCVFTNLSKGHVLGL